MKIYLYLMDGVSGVEAEKLKINKLIFKSLALKPNLRYKNIYGFDNTSHSFLSFILGVNPIFTSILSYRNNRFIHRSADLFKVLKKNKYKTYFFSNNCAKNKALFLHKFDFVFHYIKDYIFSKLTINKNIFNQNSLIFIHDLFTHDQNGLYSKGIYNYRVKDYRDLILQNFSKNLKKNLEKFHFDKKNDILILFSDHGLTMVEDCKSNYFKYFSSLEYKSKIFLNVYSPFENSNFVIKKPRTLIDLNIILKSLIEFQKIPIWKIDKFKQIFIGNYGQLNKFQLKFKCFFWIDKSRSENSYEKYIVDFNRDISSIKYNLSDKYNNILNISYNNLPRKFKNNIKLYMQKKITLISFLFFINNRFLNLGSIKWLLLKILNFKSK